MMLKIYIYLDGDFGIFLVIIFEFLDNQFDVSFEIDCELFLKFQDDFCCCIGINNK